MRAVRTRRLRVLVIRVLAIAGMVWLDVGTVSVELTPDEAHDLVREIEAVAEMADQGRDCEDADDEIDEGLSR